VQGVIELVERSFDSGPLRPFAQEHNYEPALSRSKGRKAFRALLRAPVPRSREADAGYLLTATCNCHTILLAKAV